MANCTDGWTQAAVAGFLGVHSVTVAERMARCRRDGAGGLAAQPTPGRPSTRRSSGRGRRSGGRR